MDIGLTESWDRQPISSENEPYQLHDFCYPANSVRGARAKGRLVNRKVSLVANGFVNFDSIYEFGLIEAEAFMTNARGPICWYQISYPCSVSREQLVGVWFEGTGQVVAYDPEKVSYSGLLKAFRDSKIQFTHFLNEKEIARLLYEFFVYAIPNQITELLLPCKAGWLNRKFYSCESVKAFKRFLPKDAQIRSKGFVYEPLNQQKLKMFLGEIKAFPSWKDRIMVMVFPFVALISSLIPMELREKGHALNVILPDTVQMSRIAVWFQIFNRSELCCDILSTSTLGKAIDKILKNLQDEVLIVDAICDGMDTYYYKNEVLRKSKRIVESVNGRLRDVPASCVIVSNSLLMGAEAYKLVLPEDFKPTHTLERLQADKVYESIFSEFIMHVTSLLNQKHGNLFPAGGDAVTPYVFCFDVLNAISRKYDCDLCAELDLEKTIDINVLFEDVCLEEEEWSRMFVYEFRSFVKNRVVFRSKENSGFAENVIIFDGQHLWVPRDLLDTFLNERGLLIYRERLLLQLKDENILLVEGRGYMVRLQINGDRQVYYKFIRAAFNSEGILDIIDLGKEEADDL